MGNRAFPELGSDIMQQIYLTAIKRYPNEACGFLVRTTGEKYRFMEARNVAENPENTFVMHADDIIAAEDAGDVVAIWHSHTDASADASVWECQMATTSPASSAAIMSSACITNVFSGFSATFRASMKRYFSPVVRTRKPHASFG